MCKSLEKQVHTDDKHPVYIPARFFWVTLFYDENVIIKNCRICLTYQTTQLKNCQCSGPQADECRMDPYHAHLMLFHNYVQYSYNFWIAKECDERSSQNNFLTVYSIDHHSLKCMWHLYIILLQNKHITYKQYFPKPKYMGRKENKTFAIDIWCGKLLNSKIKI